MPVDSARQEENTSQRTIPTHEVGLAVMVSPSLRLAADYRQIRSASLLFAGAYAMRLTHMATGKSTTTMRQSGRSGTDGKPVYANP
jgi:hypothetical protein